MIQYLDYENIDIDEEFYKIARCTHAEVILNTKDKRCLFIMGMLFACGVKITVLNDRHLNPQDTKKSFPLMSYVWEKLGDDSFPSHDYSNVITEMDKRIEIAKRAGFKIDKVFDNPIDNRIFLICPVRDATSNQRNWIEEFVREKYTEGYIVHAPHMHTNQIDILGGYSICRQNAAAVAISQEVDIYYDQSSSGSVFDLGVAYALHKPLKVLNKDMITFNDDDFVDTVIKTWPYNQKIAII